MAYAIAWNESNPVGASTAMSDVDAEIQNLKKSVRERMNDVLSNAWETDASNPKTLDSEAIVKGGRVKVRRNAVQSIANATPTDISWEAEIFDVGSMWAVGSPTDIVIPSDGDYLIIATVLFVANATGQRSIGIFTTPATETASVRFDAAAGGDTELCVSAIISLNSTNVVVAKVLQSSGGALNISPTATY